MANAKIVMYSMDGCEPCMEAKSQLHRLNVGFTECNIDRQDSCMNAFNRLGGTGTPLIFVDNTRIDGYTESSLNQALKRHGYIK